MAQIGDLVLTESGIIRTYERVEVASHTSRMGGARAAGILSQRPSTRTWEVSGGQPSM